MDDLNYTPIGRINGACLKGKLIDLLTTLIDHVAAVKDMLVDVLSKRLRGHH